MHQSKRLSIFYMPIALFLVLFLIVSAQANFFFNMKTQRADVEMVGETAHDKAGFSLSSGDIDGDGIDDIIIGAPGYTAELGQKSRSVTYVVYGAASIADSIPLPPSSGVGISIWGLTTDQLFGFSTASGDVDGDGKDDILIGAPEADPANRVDAGKVYIVYGSATLPHTIDLSSPGGVRVTSIYGIDENDKCGLSLVSGDIVGDSRADVIIGAPDADSTGGINAGEVYVITGSLTLPSVIDLASASDVTTILGANSGDRVGNSVVCGNINGMGKKDLLLGAPEAENLKGKAYVIYGRTNLSQTIDLTTQSDVLLNGTASSGRVGFSLTSGDLNGDTFADLLIGAPYADREEGIVYLVYGSGSLSDTIDLETQADVVLSGENPGDRAGFSLSSANINGGKVGSNQLCDLIVGAPGAANWEGRTYVIFGCQDLPTTFTLDSTSVDIGIIGEYPWGELGFSVGSGNINGDEIEEGGVEINDLITASPMADPEGKDDAGMIYIIKGFELPKLLSVTPQPNSIAVDSLTDISAVFNIQMDTTTINAGTFQVYGNQTGLHSGSFSFTNGDKTVNFDPDENFAPGEVVRVVLVDNIKSSLLSIPLQIGYSFSFTIQTSVYGCGEYATDTTLTIFDEPVFVAAADFDNDGDIDLVSINRESNDFTIIKNQNCGYCAVDASYSAQQKPQFCFCGDLNRDGWIDIAITNSYSDNVSIFYNDGDGTFTDGGIVGVGDFPLGIFGADLDGNGCIDLIVADANSDQLSVLLNQGDSTFIRSTYSTGAHPVEVCAADVDRDFDTDIALVNEDGNTLSIFLNDGLGNLTLDTSYSSGIRPTALYANDFNADGWVDIATVNVTDNTSNPGYMRIFLNDADGTFSFDANYEVGRFPNSICGGDLDDDGDIDLAVGNIMGSKDVIVFLNAGDATFSEMANYDLSGNNFSISLFDYNCDGDLDFAAALAYSDQVVVLENLAPSPKIVQTFPEHNSINTLITTDIRVTFDLKMLLSSFDDTLSFVVQGRQTGLHKGTFQLAQADFQVIFSPDEPFAPGEEVLVTLTTEVKSQFPEIKSMKEGYTLCFTVKGGGSGTFPSDSVYDVGSDPRYAYGGDLNGNGNIDLVVSNYADNNVTVLINNGSGNFVDSIYSVGTNPRGLYGCDLDDDGDMDLAIINQGSDDVSVYWNNGDGTFALPCSTISLGDAPYSVWCGDLDSDGYMDIAVVNSADNDLSVLWNEGNRNFIKQNYPTDSYPRSIYGADFNHDNSLDIAIVNYNAAYITVLLNDGGRSFSTHQHSPFLVNSAPVSICSAGLDTNNHPDIAVANQQAGQSDRISVLINDEGTTFLDQVTYGVPKNPNWVASADIDGDDDIDLVVPNWYSDEHYISALFNNGDGTFGSDSTLSEAVATPNFVYPTDFNNDGFIDLAVVSSDSNQVVILWNYAPAPQVVSTTPELNAVDVTKNSSISITFDIDMESSTIDTNTLLVTGDLTGTYSGEVSYDSGNRKATFDPDSNFTYGEVIAVSLTTGVRSAKGAQLKNGYVFSFVVESGNGYCEFDDSSGTAFSIGTGPRSVTAGDLNRDGFCDLVTSNANDSTISLLLNNRDTTFTESIFFAVIANPFGLAAADFNRDSYLDLAVTNQTPSGSVSVFLNNQDTTFSRQDYPVGNNPTSIFTGDLNGDGHSDLAVTNLTDSTFSLLFNDGYGSFDGEAVYSISGEANGLNGRDFDSDGDIDLCVASSEDNSLSIFKNRGEGTFDFLVKYTITGSPKSLTCNDFNGDRLCDIAVLNFSTDKLTVLRNTGNGYFTIDAQYDVGDGPYSIISSDYDGDGWIDIAAANRFTDDVSVLENAGDGSFLTAAQFSVGDDPFSVCRADLDGDGDVDLATANNSSNDISLLLNKGPGVGIKEFEVGTILPSSFSLSQNYPNPFNSTTIIQYQLSADGGAVPSTDLRIAVTLEVFNILGEKVATLVNDKQTAGYKTVVWNTQDLSSGIYFYRLRVQRATGSVEAKNFLKTRKMLLLK
jgi:hypothetical protein